MDAGYLLLVTELVSSYLTGNWMLHKSLSGNLRIRQTGKRDIRTVAVPISSGWETALLEQR